MNLAHLLQRQARMAPERPAIFLGTQMVATHGQWAKRCQQLAAQFQAAGLQPGDRVAMVMPQRFETAVAYMAVLQMGAVAMPLSILFGPDALEPPTGDEVGAGSA